MINPIKLLRRTASFIPKEEDFLQKIGLISIIVSLALIFIITSFFVLHIKLKRQKELIADGFALTEMVVNYTARGLDNIDANNIIKTVETMGSKSGLVFGMIMDVNGRVMTHTNINPVDHMLTDPISLLAASSNNSLKQIYKDPLTDNTIHEFSRPLFNNGKKEGIVRLAFSPDTKPLFSDSDIRGILLVATLIFSMVPIFYSLVRRTLGSLVSLNSELQQFLVRDDFQKIEVNSSEVVGKVVDRFNQAISHLQDNNNMLKVSHDDLDVANKVLFYEKERIEAVLDNMNDGILATDSVGSIIMVNKTMAHLMKFSPEEVIGKTIKESIFNQDILSFIEKNQFNGRSFAQKNAEITLKEPDWESIVRISFLQLLSPSESVMGNIITTRDITSEKRSEQNQSDFIAHVAHELRTPLTTIKSYVEMLMDDEAKDPETKIDFFNTINDEANRLSRLIDNLLNISKIEMGSLTMQKDLIKSREFLEDIVKSIEGQAVSKNIKLESVLPDKLSPLVMEKDLLRVAILNVLGNAIKYTPEGGSITFRADEDESHMAIHIIDTGYGISKEELSNIFDKFFRSSDEKIKEHPGNGLGLALTKEIIRLHDGTIDVESNIGEGTHFTLTLPREENPRISNYNSNYSSLMDN